jgi:hypothetical protein
MRLILNLLLMLPIIAFSQTCIIVKRTKHAIYVGADSRFSRTGIYGNGKTDTVPYEGCKIHTVGKYHFAPSGAYIDLNAETAKRVFRTAPSFSDGIIKFAEEFATAVRDSLDMVRTRLPANYRVMQDKYKGGIGNLVVFGYESDTQFVRVLKFETLLLPQSVTISPWLYSIHKDSAFAVGEINGLHSIINDKKTWRGSYKKAIINLIKVQSKYTPMTVALPVDIMKVVKRRDKWILRKQYCLN